LDIPYYAATVKRINVSVDAAASKAAPDKPSSFVEARLARGTIHAACE
jgi:hypothetical protein